MKLQIYISIVLCGYLASLGSCDDPLVLWTQTSYIWSKIKGLQGTPDTWLPLKLKPYVQSQTYKESQKYAIAYNPATDHVIWSDLRSNKILKQTLSGNVYHRNDSVKELYFRGNAEISSLAVDWLSHNVYFIDRGSGLIGIQSLDEDKANIHKVLFKGEGFEPVSLAVDPFEGLVFWTNAAKGSVDAGSTNGSLPQTLVSGLKTPRGITLDTSSQTLYYIDGDTINRISYDGTRRKTIWTSPMQQNYFEITLLQDYILIAMGRSLQIHVHSKSTGDFVGSADIDAEVFHIVTVETQDIPPHACQTLNCDHLCLNSGLSEPAKCTCSDGFTLDEDARSCTIVPVATGEDPEENNALVIIAGAVAAATFFLVLLALLFCCLAIRRCKRKKTKGALRSVSQDSFDAPVVGSDSHLYANGDMFHEIEQVSEHRDTGNTPNTENGIPIVPTASVSVKNVEKSFKSRISAHGSRKSRTRGRKMLSSVDSDKQVNPEDSPPPSSTVSLSSVQSTRPLSSGSTNNFQLHDSKNVATVIQRLTNRLRKGLSSIRFNESQRRPGIDTAGNNDNNPADNEEIHDQIRSYPETAKFPPNKRKLFIPSKLHKEPRGWAPASHNVPRTVISTLGRAKGQVVAAEANVE